MSNLKCSQCRLVNASTETVCRRCGAALGYAPNPEYAHAAPYAGSSYAQQPQTAAQPVYSNQPWYRLDTPVCLQGFEGRQVVWQTGLLTKPKLLVDGQQVKKQNKRFHLVANDGSALEVLPKARFLDPIPKLEVRGQIIELAPALNAIEYIWIMLPLALV